MEQMQWEIKRKKPQLKSVYINNPSDGDQEWTCSKPILRDGMPFWSSLPQAQPWHLVE
jgi:hypothetical protein